MKRVCCAKGASTIFFTPIRLLMSINLLLTIVIRQNKK